MLVWYLPVPIVIMGNDSYRGQCVSWFVGMNSQGLTASFILMLLGSNPTDGFFWVKYLGVYELIKVIILGLKDTS